MVSTLDLMCKTKTKRKKERKEKERFSCVGVKTWNEIPNGLKPLSKEKKSFTKELKETLLGILKTEDSHIEIDATTLKLKHHKVKGI